MITEDFANFEISKLLKQKGFDIICDYAYNNKGGYFEVDRSNFDEVYCFRPSLALAMKWLRDVHKLHISVVMGFDVDNSQYFFYVPSVCRFSNKSGEYQTPFGEKEFGSYEEACEAVIKYCLENLI